MTKEEMILWATFMAGCDVAETPLCGYFPEELVPDEVAEVWSCGLIVEHADIEVCIIPDKSKGLDIKTFVWNDSVFAECDWKPTDEELVDFLKEKNYYAAWVSEGAIKHMILKKFPDAINY